MYTTNLRKVGGSVMLAVPPAVLDILHLQAGAQQRRTRVAPCQADRRRAYLMKRGEIWLVGLDPTQGHEQKGRRPVLIVSPEVVLPITSGGNFARTAGLAVPLADIGNKTTGVVRCDRPRALHLGARNGRKLETVSDSIGRSAGEVDADF